jgi:hypothetical protein
MNGKTIKAMAIVSAWGILAILALGQDKTPAKPAVCKHDRPAGLARPVDLAEIDRAYSRAEALFKEFSSSSSALSSRARTSVSSGPISSDLRFDSGLKRSRIQSRRMNLGAPFPESYIGAEIVLGDADDCLAHKETAKRNKPVVYLLVAVSNAAELQKARKQLGPSVALATLALTKLFKLEGYPARITVEEQDRVKIEALH